MKRAIWVIFIIGVIVLCSFFTPISHGGMTQRGYYITESSVLFSSIFDTTGPISVGRFLLFLLVCAIICYSLSMVFKGNKEPKPPAN
jgi:uncharacterized membrane protein